MVRFSELPTAENALCKCNFLLLLIPKAWEPARRNSVASSDEPEQPSEATSATIGAGPAGAAGRGPRASGLLS